MKSLLLPKSPVCRNANRSINSAPDFTVWSSSPKMNQSAYTRPQDPPSGPMRKIPVRRTERQGRGGSRSRRLLLVLRLP